MASFRLFPMKEAAILQLVKNNSQVKQNAADNLVGLIRLFAKIGNDHNIRQRASGQRFAVRKIGFFKPGQSVRCKCAPYKRGVTADEPEQHASEPCDCPRAT
jgi:hypothetical protein